LELTSVYTTIVNPKIASNLIKALNCLDDLPLPHLKRIRRSRTNQGDVLEAILFPTSVDRKTVLDFLCKINDSEWIIKTVQVSKLAPVLRSEFEQWKGYWPMSFYERSDLIDELDPADQDYANKWCQKLQDLMPKSCTNMAIIVHPETQEIMALGYDNRHHHPLKHAVMNAIEQVAVKEVQDRDLKVVKKKRALDEPNYGYLCTGLEIFIYQEPCVMCSMALVHSRIKRLFFLKKNISNGGITSKYNLSMHKNLNHHFKSYVKDD
jgi:tRNA-specific adenosine deaminase 3